MHIEGDCLLVYLLSRILSIFCTSSIRLLSVFYPASIPIWFLLLVSWILPLHMIYATFSYLG